MKKVHRFVLPPEIAHQVRDVLKMRVGEQIDVTDGEGNEGRATIASMEKGVEVEMDRFMPSATEPTGHVALYCSILKRENFEWVIQKATEVGASEIIPITSARTVKLGVKLERWQTIAREAAEQAGRGVVPTVREPMTLKEALAKAEGAKIFFDVEGEMAGRTKADRVSLFIGPEGGWDADEVAAAKEAGCVIASLGSLVLRAETAATIATYLAAQKGL